MERHVFKRKDYEDELKNYKAKEVYIHDTHDLVMRLFTMEPLLSMIEIITDEDTLTMVLYNKERVSNYVLNYLRRYKNQKKIYLVMVRKKLFPGIYKTIQEISM